MTNAASRISAIAIDDPGAPGFLAHEKQTALHDLIEHGQFQPVNDTYGPYALRLSLEDNRLVMRIKNAREHDLSILVLSMKPYKRIIQDYFMMIESYEEARRHALPAEKLEAIDMGRRGLHNEGADLLIDRLKDKIDMDHETARRLFTLICTLNKGSVRFT